MTAIDLNARSLKSNGSTLNISFGPCVGCPPEPKVRGSNPLGRISIKPITYLYRYINFPPTFSVLAKFGQTRPLMNSLLVENHRGLRDSVRVGADVTAPTVLNRVEVPMSGQHFRKVKGTVRLRFNVNYDGPVSNITIVIARCPRRNEFVDVSLLKCSFLRPSDEAWTQRLRR